MKYYLVDVFAEQKYSGNQLAVVLVEDGLSDFKMQSIASEFHLSETTFVLLSESVHPRYRVRIFTPSRELPFAGHPTLGTAFILRDIYQKHMEKEIILNLNIGEIKVDFDDAKSLQWMNQIEPVFGEKHSIDIISELLGILPKEMDSRFPIQVVSTGVEFLLIPLINLETMKKVVVHMNLYNQYFANSPLPLFVFCPETYEKENSINARMFAPSLGVLEDPATGSANGCLAGYLAHYKYFGSENIDLRVEQGYEINRRSILHIQSSSHFSKYNIRVGGRVIKIAEGNLL